MERQGSSGATRGQSALRTAAVAIDRARSSGRQGDPDDAVQTWSAFIAGRWLLCDHFDHAGRRFLVARANEPGVRAPGTLSHREGQIVAYAALGHANKFIAYELGISETSVSRAMRSAAPKLGARSRVELVRMLARDPTT